MNDFSYEHHSIDIIHKLGWQTVLERRKFLTGILMFKCIFNLAPFYLSDNITYVSQIHDHQTRNCENDNLYVPQPRTEYIKRSFLYNDSKIWNKLPLDVSPTIYVNLKSYLRDGRSPFVVDVCIAFCFVLF